MSSNTNEISAQFKLEELSNNFVCALQNQLEGAAHKSISTLPDELTGDWFNFSCKIKQDSLKFSYQSPSGEPDIDALVQALIDAGAQKISIRTTHSQSGETSTFKFDIHKLEHILDSNGRLDVTKFQELPKRESLKLIETALAVQHLPLLTQLFTGLFDINQAINKYDWPPLLIAADKGKTATVRHLLKLGADVNATDGGKQSVGLTALVLASGACALDTVKCLLEHGADPDMTTLQYSDQTGALHEPLMNLCESTDCDRQARLPVLKKADKTLRVMRYLISQGAQPQPSRFATYVIKTLVHYDLKELLEFSIQHQLFDFAKIDASDLRSYLRNARTVSMASYLVTHIKPLNILPEKALHNFPDSLVASMSEAIRDQDEERAAAMEYLLRLIASLSSPPRLQDTRAIFTVCRGGCDTGPFLNNSRVLQLLLELGVSACPEPDHEGKTPLDHARARKLSSLVEILEKNQDTTLSLT